MQELTLAKAASCLPVGGIAGATFDEEELRKLPIHLKVVGRGC